MSIVEASFLESALGRVVLFAIFHGFIKGIRGKNSKMSLLVRKNIHGDGGPQQGRRGSSPLPQQQHLGPVWPCALRRQLHMEYRLAECGGMLVRPPLPGGGVVIIEGRRGRPSFKETTN